MQQVLLRWLERNGSFEGHNVTAYVREFDLAVRMLDLTDQERHRTFQRVVQPYLDDRVRAVNKDSADWCHFVTNLRRMFACKTRRG